MRAFTLLLGLSWLFCWAAPAQAERFQNWHRQIGLTNKVQQSAGLGRGVTIAIIDTGVSANHPDLRGAMTSNSYSYTNRGPGVDRQGHGTSVASAALARRNGVGIIGVAPAAGLMAIKITDGNSASSQRIAQAIRRAAAGGAGVINLSFGYNGWSMANLHDTALHSALRLAAKTAVIVISAGNDGRYKPDDTAMHLLADGVAGRGIMAGSVNARSQDSSWSNAPGDWSWYGRRARNYFLSARGENLTLADRNGGWSSQSGTSFSAPIIAGAAALVRARHPHLTPAQTVSILLRSATDLGAKGTDTLYGRGLLNVQRALQPIGTSSFRTAQGRHSVDGSSLRVPRALSGLVSGSARLSLFDSYDRDFEIPLARLADVQADSFARGYLGSLTHSESPPLQINAGGEGTRLGLAFRQASVPAGAWDPAGDQRDTAFRLSVVQGALRFAAGRGRLSDPAELPVVARAPLLQAAGRSELADPIGHLTAHGSFAAIQGRISDGLALSFGVRQAQLADAPALGLSASRAQSTHVGILAGRPGTLSAGLTFTDLRESRSLLGGRGGGLFDFSGGTASRSLTLTGDFAATPRLILSGAVTGAMTRGGGGGAFTLDGPALSSAFAVAADLRQPFRSDDWLRISLIQPLRVERGTLGGRLLHRLDAEGQPQYRRTTASLSPDGRELDLVAEYALRPAPGVQGGAFAFAVRDRGHRQGQHEFGGGLRISLEF